MVVDGEDAVGPGCTHGGEPEFVDCAGLVTGVGILSTIVDDEDISWWPENTLRRLISCVY